MPSWLKVDSVVGSNSSAEAKIARTSGFEDVYGSQGDDLIIGNALFNRLDGFTGDDTFVGGKGADEFYGGGGRDMVDYSRETGATGVVVDLRDEEPLLRGDQRVLDDQLHVGDLLLAVATAQGVGPQQREEQGVLHPGRTEHDGVTAHDAPAWGRVGGLARKDYARHGRRQHWARPLFTLRASCPPHRLGGPP